MNTSNEKSNQAGEFAKHGTKKRSSFFGEYLYLLKNNRKWWMLPLILVLLAFGVLLVLSSSPIAPFIYTLF